MLHVWKLTSFDPSNDFKWIEFGVFTGDSRPFQPPYW